MKNEEKIKKAIEYARFYRGEIRNGLHNGASAVDMRTTASEMLTGIITILEGKAE